MSMSTGSRDYGRFDELAEEFAERFRRGERPSLQEYVDRLPEMADEIREMFPALVEVEQAEGDARADAAPPPTAVPRLRQVGDYRILREVGRGGMGVVYEAEQVSLGRRVALKALPGHVAGDHTALRRFRREAKAAAGLHHTNIVPVFEVGRDGDVAFYAMQFIQGQGLDQVIGELRRLRHPDDRKPAADDPDRAGSHAKPATGGLVSGAAAVGPPKNELERVAETLLSGRLAIDRLDFLTNQAPAALGQAATEQFAPDMTSDFTPRDTIQDHPEVRPAPDGSSSAVLPGGKHVSEVDISGRRQPFFESVAQIGRQAAQGLAYAHARGIVHRDIKPSNLLLDTAGIVWITDFGLAKAKAEDDGLTASGDILGTLRYMAPCRFRGEGDARVDIYALGLTLYELLTLRPAFDSPDRLKLIEQIKTQEPARPRTIDSRIPRDLETIVLKAIAKDADRRYPTASALAEDLRRFLADEPILARRASAAERYWRWARRNPLIAVLGGVLTGVLVLATVGSLLAAQRFHTQALAQRVLAADRETQRRTADRLRAEEAAARQKTDQANASLLATQDELRQTVYATRSNLALAAWDANNVGRMGDLLALMGPAAGEPDLRGWEWRFLWRLGHEDRLTLRSHDEEDSFEDVAFSPDGQWIASLHQKGRIQLWDRLTGKAGRTMGVTSGGQTASLAGGVSAIAFSPDGRTLAGPGADASVALYDVATGLPTLRLEGTSEPVQALAWSPDGRTLVAGISKHVMKVWHARDGRLIHPVFGGHTAAVVAVAFSPDGRTLASGSHDHTVKLWNPEDPRTPRAVLKGHTDQVETVAFSPDGRRIASAGRDQTLRIWDAASGASLAVIWGHTSTVTSLAFLPDSARVVTGSADETARIWEIATGQELRTFKGTDGSAAVAVSPDGRDIASAGDVTVRVWDAASPPRVRTLQSPSRLTYGAIVECLAFSPDGRRLASGHEDYALRVWDLPADRPPRLIKTGYDLRLIPSLADTASIPNAGKGLVIVANVAGLLHFRIFDCMGKQVVDTDETKLEGQAQPIEELRNKLRPYWPPHQLNGTESDMSIRRITSILGHTLKGHVRRIKTVVFSPDGRTIACGGDDGTVRLWDAATGEPGITFTGHTGELKSLVFTPDGQTLISAGADGTIQAWGPATGVVRYVLQGHTQTVHSLALSPDGRTLASASYDTTCILWDLATRTPRVTLRGHTEDVNTVVFSPDGRIVATSSNDETVRLWDASDGSPRGLLVGHGAEVDGLAFSPDGRLASSSYDKTIRIWDTASRQTLLVLGGHAGRIRWIQFSPDGRTLASASYDRTIKLWEAAPLEVLSRP